MQRTGRHPVLPHSIPVLRISISSPDIGRPYRQAGGTQHAWRCQRSANRCSRRQTRSPPTKSSESSRTGRLGLHAGEKIGWTGVHRMASGHGGKSHPYPKVPVTQADKDRVLTQVREHGKQLGCRRISRSSYPFADNKPPFDFRAGSPNGEVWLQRPRAGDDAIQMYDVFDRKGRLAAEIKFPSGATLAGFGSRGGCLRLDQGRPGHPYGEEPLEAAVGTAQSRIGGSSPGGVFGPGTVGPPPIVAPALFIPTPGDLAGELPISQSKRQSHRQSRGAEYQGERGRDDLFPPRPAVAP